MHTHTQTHYSFKDRKKWLTFQIMCRDNILFECEVKTVDLHAFQFANDCRFFGHNKFYPWQSKCLMFCVQPWLKSQAVSSVLKVNWVDGSEICGTTSGPLDRKIHWIMCVSSNDSWSHKALFSVTSHWLKTLPSEAKLLHLSLCDCSES